MSNTKSEIPHIFISYAHEDREIAKRIRRELRRLNHLGWLDMDIRPGTQRAREIASAIKDSSAVILVLTPAAIRSDYVAYEWAFALGAGLRVIPVIFEHPRCLHPVLGSMQHLDFTALKKNWVQLTKALAEATNEKPERTGHANMPPEPTICAELEIDDNGRPVRNGREYRIWVWIRNAPEETKRVKYEILDDSFSNNPWTVSSTNENFRDWISSYGDVYMTATGKVSTKKWTTKTTLWEALHCEHRRKLSKPIKEAMDDIKNH